MDVTFSNVCLQNVTWPHVLREESRFPLYVPKSSISYGGPGNLLRRLSNPAGEEYARRWDCLSHSFFFSPSEPQFTLAWLLFFLLFKISLMYWRRWRKSRNSHVLSVTWYDCPVVGCSLFWIIFSLWTELNYLFSCLWAFPKCRLISSSQLLMTPTDSSVSTDLLKISPVSSSGLGPEYRQ